MTSHPLLLTTNHCFYVMAQTLFIICIIYDVTHTVCMSNPALYLTWNTLKLHLFHSYVITPSLLKTSHLQCKISQVPYVCHHLGYTGHDIHTLWQPLLFMTSHALYSFHHKHYIWHLIYSVWCHIHYVCYITQWHYFDIKHYMFMTYSHYMASHTVLSPHNHCVHSQPICLTLHLVNFWHYTQCNNFMKRREGMSSQRLYVWHHMHYIWHHIHSLWPHTTLFVTSCPLCLATHPFYLTSRPLYLCSHPHSLNDITATLCIISHTVYMLHPIHYIYDIISTMYDNTTLCVVDMTLGICVTSFALQMISHQLYHTKPQYLWLHMPFRHGITPTVSDITPTVSLSSQPLHWYHTQFCMTS